MIDTDLLRLLTFPIYTREEHPRREDKYAYDEEFVHYAMLGLLLEQSMDFRRAMLSDIDLPANLRVVGPIPSTCPFDLQLRDSGGRPIAFIEVKTWAGLSDDQFQRQTAHLRAAGGCRGYYVLSEMQLAKWSSRRIGQESQGLSRCVTFADVSNAARAVPASDSMGGIAAVYSRVIEALLQRTRDAAA